MDTVEQFIEKVQPLTGFDAPFLRYVADLLGALGYVLQESDIFYLSHCVLIVEEEIKNSCNVSSVPEGLSRCAASLIVGEFLRGKKNTGQLEGFELALDPVLKQLEEGDTKITWAVGDSATPEAKLDSFIDYLLKRRKEFVTFRRLAW